MAGARDPWWVIGSAAMALHGAPVEAADIDLLVSVGDAERLFALAAGPPSDRFRSARFGTFQAGTMTVEVMAGFELFVGGAWHDVRPPTREALRVGDAWLYTPGVQGLIDLCRAFDRPKDRERTALLVGPV
jgi:hypothetical protein